MVRNSVVNGEYLGWYSDGLTFVGCRITGTLPFCYCRNLRLIDCEMHGTDLTFGRSDVDAVLVSRVESIKNPRSGRIVAPDAGELIIDDPASSCDVVIAERRFGRCDELQRRTM